MVVNPVVMLGGMSIWSNFDGFAENLIKPLLANTAGFRRVQFPGKTILARTFVAVLVSVS